jgi:hypothetical protein
VEFECQLAAVQIALELPEIAGRFNLFLNRGKPPMECCGHSVAHSARPAVEFQRSGRKASFGAALVAIALGEHDRPFQLLERAILSGSESIPFLAVDPQLKAQHGDARSKTLLSRIQLAPERYA